MSQSNQAGLSRFLSRLLLRSELSAEEQSAVLSLPSHALQAQARHDILGQGQTVTHACLVSEGLVARFDQMSDGRRQITAFHFPGDMCDLHSVPCATAGWGLMAISTSTILHIAHADILALALKYPGLAMAFWRDTVVDASILAKWVSNVGRKDAKSGMAHLICELALRMELAGLGTRESFHLETTQEQLGDALGVTPVHVNRTFKLLRTADLVAVEGRNFCIRDWERLVAVGDFDPAYMLLQGDSSRKAA